MNKVILLGRLTRDPETAYSKGEESKLIVRYTLAVDRKINHKAADFIPCVAFGRMGEFAEKHFFQGMRVLISGRIQTGSYINKDGKKVYTTTIIVEEQNFADGKQELPVPAPEDENGFMRIPDGIDEELPFC